MSSQFPIGTFVYLVKMDVDKGLFLLPGLVEEDMTRRKRCWKAAAT